MRFAGDPAIHSTEVEQCVRRHQAGVWHYLRLLGADPEAADDLAQETFLVMLRKGFVAKAPEATACYLRRTARFLFLEHRRRSKSGRWEQDSGAWADAVDAAWAAGRARDLTEEWLAALRRCRDRLAGRRREAVSLFYGGCLGRDQVARRLGMKPAGVKSLLQRVRRDLRDCITRELS